MAHPIKTTIAAALMTLPLLAVAAPAALTITPVSGKYERALALNDEGRYAVNQYAQDVPYRIAYISRSPMLESVGTLGGTDSYIAALNNKGEAVGQSDTAAGGWHAFLYSAGQMRDLTSTTGIATANAINDRGDIAGLSSDNRAMVLKGGSVDVFGPAGSTVADINEAGEVAGTFVKDQAGIFSYIYSQGKMTELPTLGGFNTFAAGLNDSGFVTGTGRTADYRDHAFLFDGTAMIDLTPTASIGAASDINNLGHVVGSVNGRAFLYADGKMIDLNTLVDPGAGVLLTAAFAINEREQILANACDTTGVFCYTTVLLTPVPAVPEPSRTAMMLGALALLGLRARRNKQSACRR